MINEMKWYIQEGFYLEQMGRSLFLVYEPDESSVMIAPEELTGVINALKQARSYYRTREAEEADRDALARWGKAPIPTTD